MYACFGVTMSQMTDSLHIDVFFLLLFYYYSICFFEKIKIQFLYYTEKKNQTNRVFALNVYFICTKHICFFGCRYEWSAQTVS